MKSDFLRPRLLGGEVVVLFAARIKEVARRIPGRPVGWGPPAGFFRAVDMLESSNDGRVALPGQEAFPAGNGSIAERTGLRPETQQPHPVCWIAFRSVHVIGRGNSPVDRQGRIAFEGFMTPAGLQEEADYNYWALPRAHRLRGNYTSLNNARFPGDNYYHWLHDCLPKLMLLDELPPDTSILVENPSLPFKKRSLQLLGLWDRVVPSLAPHYHVDNFYFIPPLCQSGGYNPAGLKFLREKFLSSRNCATPDLRVFVTRRTKHRRLANLQEVEMYFRENGWIVVDGSAVSLDEQIDVFQRAAMVCGLHGAAMTNIAWCNPGTRVLELFPGSYLNACYEIMARTLGLPYQSYVLSDHGRTPDVLDIGHWRQANHDFLEGNDGACVGFAKN